MLVLSKPSPNSHLDGADIEDLSETDLLKDSRDPWQLTLSRPNTLDAMRGTAGLYEKTKTNNEGLFQFGRILEFSRTRLQIINAKNERVAMPIRQMVSIIEAKTGYPLKKDTLWRLEVGTYPEVSLTINLLAALVNAQYIVDAQTLRLLSFGEIVDLLIPNIGNPARLVPPPPLDSEKDRFTEEGILQIGHMLCWTRQRLGKRMEAGTFQSISPRDLSSMIEDATLVRIPVSVLSAFEDGTFLSRYRSRKRSKYYYPGTVALYFSALGDSKLVIPFDRKRALTTAQLLKLATS